MLEKIAILQSEINRDLEKINRLFKRFVNSYNEYQSSQEYSKLLESAFYVNQIYTGFEHIFKNIAKTFENNIEEDYWHKSLLERMTLEIKDIRPAVLSQESFKCLNELRSFRHFFRHAYDIDIDKEKFKIIADRVLRLLKLYKREINKFLAFLDKLSC